MAQFSSIPEVAHLTDLLVRFPKNVQALMAYNNAVLRSDGALSIAERELIAAYVSGLNACQFCFGSHEIYARAFGIKEGVIDGLLNDIDTAEIDAKLKPIIRYVKKLNALPSKMVPVDSQLVFDAGWPEEALFEAIEVSGLFNMMNRIIEGSGVNFSYSENPDQHTIQSNNPDALASSYVNYGNKIAGLTRNKKST